MPTRGQVCTWIAGLSLVVPTLVAAQDQTERDVVELIVREGPRARAIRAATEVTRREQLARLSFANPAVEYSREGAGFTEFLQVQQSLRALGLRSALSRAGIDATAAAEAERDAGLAILRAEAATWVARLVAEQERLLAAESMTNDVQGIVEVLRIREREGEGSRFDRLRAEQEVRDARQSVTATAIAVASARASVSALLPSGTVLGQIRGSQDLLRTAPPQEILMARARSTRAELRALERAGSRADFEAQAARRARRPAPTVFGGLKRADDESGRVRGGVFGVNVSLPLFDTGSRDAARWAAERTRVDAERAALEEQIRSEITRGSEALTLRNAAAFEDQQAAGDDLMRIAEVAYREGEVGILELLDAVRTASRARTRTIDIQLEVRLAEIALERALGDVLWP
jgi:cobalt-zinc-cadmium efflux system outer membrane protein